VSRRIAALLLAALAPGCRGEHSQEAPGATPATAMVAAPERASRDAGASATRPGKPLGPRVLGAPGELAGARPGGIAGLLAGRAPEPGKSRTHITGCLGVASGSDADGDRFPAPPPTRAAPAPAVSLTARAGAVTVKHELQHACCLRADVSTTVAGSVAEIHEKLGGNPCRCRCRSTIQTEIGLAPGTYTVRVVLEESGGPKTVATEQVTVPPR